MLTVDAYLKATAAVVSGAFALVLWTGARDKPAARLLGTFMLLISINQVAETARALAPPPPTDRLLYQIASVAASLDPFVLFAFVAFSVERSLERPAFLALVGAGSVALALDAAVGFPGPAVVGSHTDPYPLLLTFFTGAVYLGVLFWCLARGTFETDPGRLPVLPALSVAAIPVAAQAVVLVWYALPNAQATTYLQLFEAEVLTLAVVSAALLLAARRTSRRVAYASVLAAALLAILTLLPSLVTPEDRAGIAGLVAMGRAQAAVRWLLFGMFASMAIFRDDLFGMSVAARRRAARVLIATAFLVGATVALAAVSQLGGVGRAVDPIEIAILGIVIAISQSFKRLVDRVAHRVFGVPMIGDARASQETYRLHVASALAQGRVPRQDPEIQHLRRDLEIDSDAAEMIERHVEESDRSPIAAGQLFAGRYQVEHLLGRGGRGRVFLARDILLGRKVVLKEILWDGPRADETALAEARIAGGLDHPNIVTTFDVVRRPGYSVIVAEFMPGGTLAQRLREAGRLGAREGVGFLDTLLGALETVHARGIVHRDIKPDNVLLTASGAPKLADFGIARVHGATTETLAVGVAGTPDWMAPEQKEHGLATPATDIFAIGLLAARCIEAPLPPGVQEAVACALRDDPTERWPTAAEMRAALRPYVQ